MARPKKDGSSLLPSVTIQPSAAVAAFSAIERELAGVTPVEAVPDDLDIAALVANTLTLAPRLLELRATIVEQLPRHPIDKLDNLERYALALWYADLVNTYASKNSEGSAGLLDEATRLREGLLVAAEALAHRALLDPEAVARIRKGSGQSELAGDLVTLAAMYSASWAQIASKTAVEREEVDRATEIGPMLLVALTARKQTQSAVDPAEQEARAYSLLLQAYDRCRQAIAYLRWKEGDLETIAPPLLPKRRARRGGDGEA